MKKYVKPDLYYENFELSEHVANCSWIMNSLDACDCVVEADPALGFEVGTILFCEGNVSCTETGYEIYCYTNNQDTFGLWRS